MIPIGTSYQMRRTPWVNYGLVIANVVIYVLGYNGAGLAATRRIAGYLLDPVDPHVVQFFSSVFLHGGLMHLIGNMVFLWVFGNPVNDRFGHLGYLMFYLGGGVFAGLGYVAVGETLPALGASGAISAVAGAFLVLLPRTRVTVLLLFLYILMPVEISSLLFLLFHIAWDVFMALRTSWTNQPVSVAHWAHSSGYFFGIAVAAGLLISRLLPRDPFDLINLLRTHHRRSRYRRMVARGYDPFNYVSERVRRGDGRPVQARTVGSETPDGPEGRRLQLRREAAEQCARGDLSAAAQAYLRLLDVEADAVLARQNQIDIANQLMAEENYPAAARAYERFLQAYSNYEYRADIHLMLGILYGRYLRSTDKAVEYLEQAVEGLSDVSKRELAQAELQRLRQDEES